MLKRLFVLPSAKTDEGHTAEVWMMVLEGQPIASIVHAFNRFLKDTARTFRPTPGQFLAVVEEHATRVRLKAKALESAITGAKT